MGDIIRLRPRQGARHDLGAPHTPHDATGEGATILLFMGVRYERHEQATPAKTPGKAKGSRRKRA